MPEALRTNPKVRTFLFLKKVDALSTILRFSAVALFNKAVNWFFCFQKLLPRIQRFLNRLCKISTTISIGMVGKLSFSFGIRTIQLLPSLGHNINSFFLNCLPVRASLPIVLIPN